MLFQIVESGRALRVQSESREDVREMVQHFKLDPFNHVDAIASGELVHLSYAPARDNGQWFAVETQCGPEWLAPYMDRLQRITGYSGPIPTIDNAPWNAYGWKLSHTHIVTRATISPAGYFARGFDSAQDWNGRTAEQNARSYFAEYVRDDIGDRKSEPQYIRLGNGLLKDNPNYMRRHAPHVAAKNRAIFGALLQWWTDNAASAGQRELLAAAFACHRTVCKRDTLGEWLLREDSGFRTDWSGPLVTFDQFHGV